MQDNGNGSKGRGTLHQEQFEAVSPGDLEVVRRIDWRFLIPGATLKRVAYLGSGDPALLRALKVHSKSLTILSPETDLRPDEQQKPFDLVVLRSANADLWCKAKDLLREGGVLYCEIDRLNDKSMGLLRAGRAEDYAESMRRCGFAQAKLYWHWGRFSRCSRIMPFEDQAARSLFLGEKQKNFKRKCRHAVLRFLESAGLLGRAIPCFSIVAMKGKARSKNQTELVLNFLEKNWRRLPLQEYGEKARLSFVMLTPGFQASAHMVILVLQQGFGDPILVVKVPRIVGDNRRIEIEYANLARLHAHFDDVHETTPRVLTIEDFGKNRLMVRKSVNGTPMSPERVRKNPERCIDTVLTWLIDLNQSTRHSSHKAAGWYNLLVEGTLADFITNIQATALEKAIVQRTRQITQPLADETIPLVFEHGDLSSPNILLNQHDRIAVVDWELATHHGLPGSDLFFFLSYIAFSLEKARDYRDYLTAFGKAFFGPRAWAKPYILRYAREMGIDTRILPIIFVTCWSRYVSGLVVRLAGSEGKLGSRRTNWLRSNRYYSMWLYTLKNLKDLNITDEGVKIPE